ncbi:MAG: nitrilase-related carbon-nitrogen hydrolase [Acidobacteriota bacterium]
MERKIGFAQFEPRFGETDANLRAVERLAAEAAGADLLVFPELAVSGYEFVDRDELLSLAEPFGDGPTSVLARSLAILHNAALVIGYPESCGEMLYNSCVIATPDGRLANYRKTHLFSRETVMFARGEAPPPVVQTPAGRVGVMVCFDWVFPEASRILALAGAQIIAHPSNLVLQFCQRVMFARSVENAVYSITANRIGTESRAGRTLTFTGASQILSPQGELLAQAPTDAECVSIVTSDISRADDKRMTECNDLLADRRVELYGTLLDR